MHRRQLMKLNVHLPPNKQGRPGSCPGDTNASALTKGCPCVLGEVLLSSPKLGNNPDAQQPLSRRTSPGPPLQGGARGARATRSSTEPPQEIGLSERLRSQKAPDCMRPFIRHLENGNRSGEQISDGGGGGGWGRNRREFGRST